MVINREWRKFNHPYHDWGHPSIK